VFILPELLHMRIQPIQVRPPVKIAYGYHKRKGCGTLLNEKYEGVLGSSTDWNFNGCNVAGCIRQLLLGIQIPSGNFQEIILNIA